MAARLTGDTGTFWFFSADNVELIAKVLDGCALNGHYWVFSTGLTNVEVELLADDTVSGRTVAYFSSSGSAYPPILDTEAFPCDV